MKHTFTTLLLTAALTGCSSIEWVQDRWPRAHDPVMVDNWVTVSLALDSVDCSQTPTGWAGVVYPAERLALYTEFRSDPQRTNMRGLSDHAIKMSKGGSKMFCELGIKTARSRLAQARTAWEGR